MNFRMFKSWYNWLLSHLDHTLSFTLYLRAIGRRYLKIKNFVYSSRTTVCKKNFRPSQEWAEYTLRGPGIINFNDLLYLIVISTITPHVLEAQLKLLQPKELKKTQCCVRRSETKSARDFGSRVSILNDQLNKQKQFVRWILCLSITEHKPNVVATSKQCLVLSNCKFDSFLTNFIIV